MVSLGLSVTSYGIELDRGQAVRAELGLVEIYD